jgi:tripartite ATP-independent transporter DctP family solute receptor
MAPVEDGSKVTRQELLRRAAAAGIAVAAAGGLGGVASAARPYLRGARAATYHWRSALELGPGNPTWDALDAMLTSIEQGSNGQIKIDRFPNAQLGAGSQNWQDLRNGTLQLNFITSSIVAQDVPACLLYALPFALKTNKTVAQVLKGNSRLAQEKALLQTGVRVLGWENIGARQLGGQKFFLKPSDLKGVKMRIAPSPAYSAYWNALGAVPTVVPAAETYTALQQGVVDAFDQPVANIISFKWYEPARYISLTAHQFSVLFFGINEQVWQSLPLNLKNLLETEVKKATEAFSAKQQVLQHAAVQQLISLNAKIVQPAPKPFRLAAAPIYKQFAPQVGGMKVINNLISSQVVG